MIDVLALKMDRNVQNPNVHIAALCDMHAVFIEDRNYSYFRIVELRYFPPAGFNY